MEKLRWAPDGATIRKRLFAVIGIKSTTLNVVLVFVFLCTGKYSVQVTVFVFLLTGN